MKTGIELIAEERQRQIGKEGWTPEHDDAHVDYGLTDAAIVYATIPQPGVNSEKLIHWLWPWDVEWLKPSSDPIRNLFKAGALIAAEIDRLQRREAGR